MTDYYVKTGGNDGADGLSDGNAWATIAKVNSVTFSPGDIISFNKGDTWRTSDAELTVTNSGTSGNVITFNSYGSGNKPRFLGSISKGSVGDWTNTSGNLWATANSSFPREVKALWYNTTTSPDDPDNGDHESTEGGLIANWDYWWDDPNDRIVVYHSVGNPANQASGIEVGYANTVGNIFRCEADDYITVDGLDFRYSNKYGCTLGNGNNRTVQNCDFYDCYRKGIFIYSSSYDTIDSNYLEACGYSQWAENSEGESIFPWASDYITVSNCEVNKPYNCAINSSGGCDNILFEYNYVYDSNIQLSNLGANMIYFDMTHTSIARYNKVENCNGGYSVNSETDSYGDYYSYGNEFYYNLALNCKYSSISIYCNQADTKWVYNNKFYNNTVWLDRTDAKSSVVNLYYAGTGNEIKNNIIMVADSNYTKWVFRQWTGSENVTLDYNCWYLTSSTTVWRHSGTTYTSFAAYQSGSSQEANSIYANPQLVDPANDDVHLQAFSTCIDNGVDVSLTEDYYGNVVPYNATEDIGAHEYQGSGAGSGTASGATLLFGANF